MNREFPLRHKERKAVVCPQKRKEKLHLQSSCDMNKTTSQVPGN